MKKAMLFVVGLVFLFSTSAFAVDKAAAPVKEEAVKAEAAKPEVKKEMKKAKKKAVKKAKKAVKPAAEKAAPAPEAAPAPAVK